MQAAACFSHSREYTHGAAPMRRIGESVRRTTVAPLRRLDEDDISVAQSDVEDAFDDAPVARTPRWIVVSGLIVYCSVF